MMQAESPSPGRIPPRVIIAEVLSSSVRVTVPAWKELPASAVVPVNADQVGRAAITPRSATTATLPSTRRIPRIFRS